MEKKAKAEAKRARRKKLKEDGGDDSHLLRSPDLQEQASESEPEATDAEVEG